MQPGSSAAAHCDMSGLQAFSSDDTTNDQPGPDSQQGHNSAALAQMLAVHQQQQQQQLQWQQQLLLLALMQQQQGMAMPGGPQQTVPLNAEVASGALFMPQAPQAQAAADMLCAPQQLPSAAPQQQQLAPQRSGTVSRLGQGQVARQVRPCRLLSSCSRALTCSSQHVLHTAARRMQAVSWTAERQPAAQHAS